MLLMLPRKLCNELETIRILLLTIQRLNQLNLRKSSKLITIVPFVRFTLRMTLFVMKIVGLSLKTDLELITLDIALVWDQTNCVIYVDVGLKGNLQTLLFSYNFFLY